MWRAKKLGRLARSALIELILAFQERVAQLEQRLKELERRLARNSSNSHLLRELKFLWEEQQEVWARQLSDLLLALHRRTAKAGPVQRTSI